MVSPRKESPVKATFATLSALLVLVASTRPAWGWDAKCKNCPGGCSCDPNDPCHRVRPDCNCPPCECPPRTAPDACGCPTYVTGPCGAVYPFWNVTPPFTP